MVNSREILLKLVRLAMGWENDYTLPDNSDIDWEEVLEIASEQGVEAIALDGLEVSLNNAPNAVSPLKSPKTRPLMLAAIGRLNMIEFNNLQHLAALVELSGILQKRDIPFLVMKGFSCARYYPIPKHRSCGDIDIYPSSRFTDSNEVLKSSGVEVGPHYYRHSVSTIKGITIENHRILCDLRGPRRQTRSLESLMEKYANESLSSVTIVEIDGEKVLGAVYPNANFNALFLPWHVSAHFEFERVTVRHLLDWTMFLLNDGKDIDIEMFREAKKKFTYGYSKFADILTALAIKYLHIPEDGIPAEILADAKVVDPVLADKVWNYMFVGQPRERDTNVWKFRLNNVKRIWKERWKYRELYNMGVLSFLYYKIVGVLFKVGEDD